MTPRTNHPEIVYILERFPGDTLNFVYNEIRGLESAGFRVDIFSILPGRLCPDEARDFQDRTRNVRPVSSGALVRAWVYFLLRKPLTMLGLLVTLPFDNSRPFIGKILKTYAHLVYAVYFAWLLKDFRGHVHAHFAFKAALAGLVAKRLNGSSFSFTAHGSATVYPPSRYCLPSKIKGADFVIAVSDYNKRVMLELCPGVDPDRIIVNRTGIILSQFPRRDREPSGTSLQILCVATLYPIKNHECLIRACGELDRRGVDFGLGLIGKDDLGLRAELEHLAHKEGISRQVTFHGGIDHGEIAVYLEQAHVCILTSFSEGVPVSLMEAMARGVPVVGPAVTGVPELIIEGVTGRLADPHNPLSFADALSGLSDSASLREKFSNAARLHVEKDYDMEKNARRLAGILKQRLQGRARFMASRKIRICYALNTFEIGGAETVALDLARSHDPEKFEVEVVALIDCSPDGESEMRCRFRNAGVKTVAIHQSSYRSPLALWRIFLYLRRGNFDIVLGHNRGADYWVGRLGLLAGIENVFWTRHLVYLDFTPKQLKRYGALSSRAQRIVAVSEAVNKACREIEKIPAEKVVTVVNGIDTDKYVPLPDEARKAIRQTLKLQPDDVFLLFVGRFSDQKAPEAFVGLVEKLRGRGLPVRGFMCGYGPLAESLEELVSEGDGGTRILGLRSDVPNLLGACDLFVSTSRNEGLPLNVMEAMAAAAPFVGPAIPQIMELLTGAPDLQARLFDPPPTQGEVGAELIESWADLVEELLRADRRPESIGLEGRRIIKSNFSLEKMVETYEGLFQEACEE